MNDVKEHLDEELKGVMDYFSLHFEYIGNEIAEDFYYFALDELRHAKFWLDMLEIKEDEDYELYKEQWEELNSLVHEERRGEVHEH